MESILIILGISGVLALALIGYVNFRTKKRKPDLTIKKPLKIQYSKMECELMLLIDKHRSDKGLRTPFLDNTISTVAKEHSLYMVKIGKVSHTNAFLRRVKLAKALGVKSSKEVVAYGQGTATGILKMWLNKKTRVTDKNGGVTYEKLHKKAIEGKDWTKFGLSIEKSTLKRNYTTFIFTK